jgi:hypothetical protein
MLSNSTILVFLFTILLSISINAYRLDSLSRLSDMEEGNELNDPYLIQRLQLLLAAAAASKRGNNGFNDYSESDHLLNRRLILNRRPGLLRLK